MRRLADLVAERQDRDSLPRPEPEVFSGDPLDYPTWKKSSETFIERKTKDPFEQLYYLGKYTSGESKEAIARNRGHFAPVINCQRNLVFKMADKNYRSQGKRIPCDFLNNLSSVDLFYEEKSWN